MKIGITQLSAVIATLEVIEVKGVTTIPAREKTIR